MQLHSRNGLCALGSVIPTESQPMEQHDMLPGKPVCDPWGYWAICFPPHSSCVVMRAGGTGRVFNRERLTSVTLLNTGVFLEPKAGIAAGLHDRLEEEPGRHQAMRQLSSIFLLLMGVWSPLLSRQYCSFCTWSKRLHHVSAT